MTRLQVLIVLGAVGWMALMVIVLAWLHAAAIAADRWDRVMTENGWDRNDPAA